MNNQRCYCGCGGPRPINDPPQYPVIIDDQYGGNTDSTYHCGGTCQLCCGCDRRFDAEQEIYGLNKMIGGYSNEKIEDLEDYLYPKEDVSPFSNIEDSAEETIPNTEDTTNPDQTGGSADTGITGKTMLELRYISARNDYLYLRSLQKN